MECEQIAIVLLGYEQLHDSSPCVWSCRCIYAGRLDCSCPDSKGVAPSVVDVLRRKPMFECARQRPYLIVQSSSSSSDDLVKPNRITKRFWVIVFVTSVLLRLHGGQVSLGAGCPRSVGVPSPIGSASAQPPIRLSRHSVPVGATGVTLALSLRANSTTNRTRVRNNLCRMQKTARRSIGLRAVACC